MLRFKTGLVLLLLFFGVQLHASPEAMLQTSAEQILSVLKANQSKLKSKPDIIYRAVEQYLLPHVDLVGMSRSVLGREAWMSASESERQAFSRAFTKLVIRTYAGPLSKYDGETVRFYPSRNAETGRFVRIESEIIRPAGPPIPLSYSMVSKNGEWKVYDLSVEGISLLQSFHNQFAQVLSHASLSELTQQMQQHQLKSSS